MTRSMAHRHPSLPDDCLICDPPRPWLYVIRDLAALVVIGASVLAVLVMVR